MAFSFRSVSVLFNIMSILELYVTLDIPGVVVVAVAVVVCGVGRVCGCVWFRLC